MPGPIDGQQVHRNLLRQNSLLLLLIFTFISGFLDDGTVITEDRPSAASDLRQEENIRTPSFLVMSNMLTSRF
jgi:hypothetical protein